MDTYSKKRSLEVSDQLTTVKEDDDCVSMEDIDSEDLDDAFNSDEEV